MTTRIRQIQRKPVRIGIVGGGFCGTMTAYHLLQNAQLSHAAVDITVIDAQSAVGKGVAYAAQDAHALLNVVTAKMSALPDQPDHFLNWVMRQPEYAGKDVTLIANAFLPRKVYGAYLHSLWQEAVARAAGMVDSVAAAGSHRALQLIDDRVAEMRLTQDAAGRVGHGVTLRLASGGVLAFDYVVLATGNALPRNPSVGEAGVWDSPHYFRNPWLAESVSGIEGGGPVLILGSGLTMADTVLGLLENGYRGDIVSLSPHGYHMLPHRHGGFKYPAFMEALPPQPTLSQTVSLLLKHVRQVGEFGMSAEPVIDSLRPRTQSLWRAFSPAEKRRFMQHCRHLWGVARHRIPSHTHERLQSLRLEGRLNTVAGRLVNVKRTESGLQASYRERQSGAIRTCEFTRIINCTGPETDLMRDKGHFLGASLARGDIAQDALKLGLEADPETFEVFGVGHERRACLFTLGSNLKGMLWESTAVNELRDQAKRLGERLARLCEAEVFNSVPTPLPASGETRESLGEVGLKVGHVFNAHR